MLNYKEALAKLKADLAGGDESKVKEFICGLTSNNHLSVTEKIRLLSVTINNSDNNSKTILDMFPAVREDIALFAYKLGQKLELEKEIRKAKKLYLVAVILGNNSAQEQFSQADLSFRSFHRQMPFLLQVDFRRLPQKFVIFIGFAEIYLAINNINDYLYNHREDKSAEQRARQQDFLELLDKMCRGVFEKLSAFLIHINLTARERKLKATQYLPFLTGLPLVGSDLAKITRGSQKYQDLRENLFRLARQYGTVVLETAAKVFKTYLDQQQSSSFEYFLLTEHAEFLKLLPIYRKVTDCKRIKYFTTTATNLWKMLDCPALIPPVCKPDTIENSAYKISVDLPRTTFLSHQENDHQLFVEKWTNAKLNYYLQGNADGGAFGALLLNIFAFGEIIPWHQMPSLRFGYLNDFGEVSGFAIFSTRCLAEQQAWFLSIMHNANAHPDEIRVQILTNISAECLPRFDNVPTFEPVLITQLMQQFIRSDKVTEFVHNLLSNDGEINLPFLDNYNRAQTSHPSWERDKYIIRARKYPHSAP